VWRITPRRPDRHPLRWRAAHTGATAVGFALGLPNLNEALQRANGLRYPWDYLRFALARPRITGSSFKILALDPAYWGCGLDALMMLELGKAIARKGYTWVDASVTGTDNPREGYRGCWRATGWAATGSVV